MVNNNKNEGTILKDSIVETPEILARDIYDTLKRKPFHKILDVGCFQGKLSKPFKSKKDLEVIGLDVIEEYKNNFDYFIHKDYLEATKEDFEGHKIDLVVSNPPFGKHSQYNELYPHLFIKKTIELFGENMPMVFIVPQWYLSNSVKRMNDLNNLKITKQTTIHKNIFAIENENISVEASILYFNLKTHKKISYLAYEKPTAKKLKKRVFKSITMTEEQDAFIKKNIPNFNKYIKELMKKDLEGFPG
jgi:predicted RNA methylase